MDKRTGMPADNNLASVTVIAENGAMADAYATALSVMGEEKAIAFQKKHPQIQIILIRKEVNNSGNNNSDDTADGEFDCQSESQNQYA